MNFVTKLHSQFNYHTLPVIPFNAKMFYTKEKLLSKDNTGSLNVLFQILPETTLPPALKSFSQSVLACYNKSQGRKEGNKIQNKRNPLFPPLLLKSTGCGLYVCWTNWKIRKILINKIFSFAKKNLEATVPGVMPHKNGGPLGLDFHFVQTTNQQTEKPNISR